MPEHKVTVNPLARRPIKGELTCSINNNDCEFIGVKGRILEVIIDVKDSVDYKYRITKSSVIFNVVIPYSKCFV